MPTLIVIGGPNGSGKTTLSSYLVKKGRIKSSIINPDEIAYRELGSYSNHVQAARIALTRRKKAIEDHVDIAFETTFSGNSEIREIFEAKKNGYTVILYYVALQSGLDNIIRVEERHNILGHDVDSEDIIRRLKKSQTNLVTHLNVFDKVYLFDNSGSNRSRVAIYTSGILAWVNSKHIDHPFYKKLLNYPSSTSTSATGLNK
jgi:predicted ABC-type ATPase